MTTHKFIYFVASLLILSLILILIPITALSSAPPPDLVQTLQQQTDGSVSISYHPETGKVGFIGTDPSHPIPQPEGLKASASDEEAARHFLVTYGSLFGLRDPYTELTAMSDQGADNGHSFVRFQQVYGTPGSPGIPVMGGELIVQMDGAKQVVSANGEVLADIKINPTPSINPLTAQQHALESVAKEYGVRLDDLTATSPELWVYNPVLLGEPGVRLNALVWRMEVMNKNFITLRELVLVDANLGVIASHFNEIETALTRKIYDDQNNNTLGVPGPNLVRSEGQPPLNDSDVDKAYAYAGYTYDFYWTVHHRDSLDGAGMELLSTVRYCDPNYPCPFANAYWNGAQMVYGDGYSSAVDVVGHEMTHGVTSHTSRLYYKMQSGAISESMSDIWGEFIDRTFVNPNNWLMGEDVPGGAIRDMSNPSAFGQPDKMTSPLYSCGLEDGGGVHNNSGVGNKAAYLMVAGGAFNGKTVTPLPGGMVEVAKIYYEAQTHLMTSATDYADLYSDVLQACSNLIGSGVTSAADCQQVKNALDAVQMNQQPTSCPATEAPVCSAGKVPTNIFFDNMENISSGNWAHAAISGEDFWNYPQFPNPSGYDATYATSGVYNIWGYDSETNADYAVGLTKDITLPPGTAPFLHFNHAFFFEQPNYDGGVIEYTTNAGAAWTDAGPLIIDNGYTGSIESAGDNPLKGRPAFVSLSNGYISSRLDLSSLAGQNVRFRFRIGTDTQGWGYGWFLDDFRVYTCGNPTATRTPTRTPTKTPTEIGVPSAYKGFLPIALQGGPGSNPAPHRTPIYSPTSTRTSQATPTGTSDVPPTSTSTSIPSITPTPTNTSIPTNTFTPTNTSVPTHTPTSTPTSTPTQPSQGWETLVNTTFEGDFPGPWNVFDNDGTSYGEYKWSTRNCRANAGTNSGWAVGGGANGGGLNCGSNYPDNTDSWMIYGPFSLVGATAARLDFKLWSNTEEFLDNTCYMASLDGNNFWGECYSGASGNWIDRSLDLSNVYNLGDLRGHAQVWVGIQFISDFSLDYPEGAYVDNITLRRCTTTNCQGLAPMQNQTAGSHSFVSPGAARLNDQPR